MSPSVGLSPGSPNAAANRATARTSAFLADGSDPEIVVPSWYGWTALASGVSPNTLQTIRFTVPAPISVSAAKFFVVSALGAAVSAKAVIFQVNAVLAATTIQSVANTTGEKSLTFASPVTLVPETNYSAGITTDAVAGTVLMIDVVAALRNAFGSTAALALVTEVATPALATPADGTGRAATTTSAPFLILD